MKSWVPPDAVVRGAVQGGDTRVQGTFKGNLLVRACAAQLPGKRKQTLWAHRNMSIDPFDSGAAHGFIYYHLPTRCATRSSGRAARRGVRTVGGQAQRRCVGVPASWDLSESEYFYCLRIRKVHSKIHYYSIKSANKIKTILNYGTTALQHNSPFLNKEIIDMTERPFNLPAPETIISKSVRKISMTDFCEKWF